MKRNDRSEMNVSRLNACRSTAIYRANANAVRFSFALRFAFFGIRAGEGPIGEQHA